MFLKTEYCMVLSNGKYEVSEGLCEANLKNQTCIRIKIKLCETHLNATNLPRLCCWIMIYA